MSSGLRELPRHLRASIYLVGVGLLVAGLGILGFIVSFDQVITRVRTAATGAGAFPWLTYVSVAAWAAGSLLVWSSRKHIDRALRERQRAARESIRIDPEGED